MKVSGLETGKVTDIVWLATGFIGDVILTTAGMELAGTKFPSVKQHLVTTAIGRKALAHARCVSSFVVLDKRGAGTIASFRSVRTELESKLSSRSGTLLFQTHRSFRSSLLSRYLGFSSVTYQETDLAFLTGTRVPRVAVFHEAARIALLLEPLGVGRDEIRMARPYLNKNILSSVIADVLTGISGPVVAVAPGSVWGTKRWTAEGFTGLIDKLGADGIKTILIGSASEEEVALQIFAAVKIPELVINLAGKTQLEDLPGLFGKCSVLVSNDSSPIHFASAVNLPTVGVFGATVPEMGFGPLADRSTTAGVNLPCRPCSDHGPMVCPLGHFQCMKNLTSESVYRQVRHILDSAKPA